jgi:hypothetical protein
MIEYPDCNRVIYPSVATGTVTDVTDTEITFKSGNRCGVTLTIRTGKFLFDEFAVGDNIYYSYALSKKPFNTSIPVRQPDYNDWYDPDTHPDIVD